ncbi:MAG: nitroreductase family protein [Pseudomonadota bacterium]
MDLENPMIKAIRDRRSIRKYCDGKISKRTLETIVDCGRLAPTSNNRQTWEFVVVTDQEKLRQLAGLATYGKFIAHAQACIVVCSGPNNRSMYLDGSAATQNMLLAIHSLGLASCWVQAVEKDYNQAIKNLLKIPNEFFLVSMVPVGLPDKEAKMPKKRPLKELLHWESFQ